MVPHGLSACLPTVIVEEGRYVRDLYVIARGSVEILAPPGRDGTSAVLGYKGVGDYFGATRHVPTAHCTGTHPLHGVSINAFAGSTSSGALVASRWLLMRALAIRWVCPCWALCPPVTA